MSGGRVMDGRDYGLDVVPGYNDNDHGVGDGGDGWLHEPDWPAVEPVPLGAALPGEGCER